MDRTRRRARAALVLSIPAISLLIASVPARAQSGAAPQKFDEAKKLFDAGKYEEACALFEEANRLEPDAGKLINLGVCREKLGQLASALAAYQDALARVKDPKKKEIASAAAASLDARVSRLTIAVTADARVAGLTVSRGGRPIDAADWGRALPIDGGRYEIAASAPGFRPWSTTVELAPEREKNTVNVPRLVEESARGAGTADPAGPARPSGPARTSAPSAARARGAQPPLGRLAVGAAFTGALGRQVAGDETYADREIGGGLRLIAVLPVPHGALRPMLQATYTNATFDDDVYHHVHLVDLTFGLDYLWAWRAGLASAAGLGVGFNIEDNNYESSILTRPWGALRVSPLIVRLGTPRLELGLHFMYVTPPDLIVGLVGIDWFVW